MALFNQAFGFGEILYKILELFKSSKIKIPDLDPVLVKTPSQNIPCDFCIFSINQASHPEFTRSFSIKLERLAEVVWDKELKESIKKFYEDYVNCGVLISPIGHKNQPEDSDINAWHKDLDISQCFIYHDQKLMTNVRKGTTLLVYPKKEDSEKVLSRKQNNQSGIPLGRNRYKIESWREFWVRAGHLGEPQQSPLPKQDPKVRSLQKNKKKKAGIRLNQAAPQPRNKRNSQKRGFKKKLSMNKLDRRDQKNLIPEEKKNRIYVALRNLKEYYNQNPPLSTKKIKTAFDMRKLSPKGKES